MLLFRAAAIPFFYWPFRINCAIHPSSEWFRWYQTMAISAPSKAHTNGAAFTSFARLWQKLMPGWGVINGGYEGSPLRLKCGLRGRRDVGFSHINMCLSGPSSPSGGGPQHQMEPSLACVSPASTCHEAAPHFPLSPCSDISATLDNTHPFLSTISSTQIYSTC